jgi:hypothetical protein
VESLVDGFHRLRHAFVGIHYKMQFRLQLAA